MIPKSGYRFSDKIMLQALEHDPEKVAPNKGAYRYFRSSVAEASGFRLTLKGDTKRPSLSIR